MTAAPIGAQVRFYFDGGPPDLQRGDAIRTPTGRIYMVWAVRVQERGKHVGRKHLTAIVAKEAPEGVRVLTMHWYPRSKRRLRHRGER